MGAGLIEFGFGVEQSATSTWMCDCIESETRSAYSSIFSTIQSVAGFIIMNLLGVLTEWNGVNAAWCVAGSVSYTHLPQNSFCDEDQQIILTGL